MSQTTFKKYLEMSINENSTYKMWDPPNDGILKYET